MSVSSQIIPLGLRQAIQSGNCVLFVGAGIGYNMKCQDGSQAPDGRQLAKEIASHFGIDTEGDDDLAKIAEVVQIQKGQPELYAFLKKRLGEIRWCPNLTLFPVLFTIPPIS